MLRLLTIAFVLGLSSVAWAQQPAMKVPEPPPMGAPVESPMKPSEPAVMAPVMAPVVTTMAPEKMQPGPDKSPQKKGSDPWWKVLLGFLAKAGLAFASALLPVLAYQFVSWIQIKLKTDKLKGIEENLDKWCEMGIKFAEQQASKLDDDPDANGKKLKLASDFVLKLVSGSGYPKKVADLVSDRIESRLKDVKGKSTSNGVAK